MSEDNSFKIEMTYKIYKRAGDYLKTIFLKEEKFLSGVECLKIMHWYGISPQNVVLIALSHGFDIDKEEFARLLDEENEKSKWMKPCQSQA